MIRLRNCNIIQFSNIIKERECYCFGCGKQAEGFFKKYKALGMEKWIKGFIDNDPEKNGTVIKINGQERLIYSFGHFLKMKNENTIVLTTSTYCHKMLEQMDKEKQLDGMECYVDYFVENQYEQKEFEIIQGKRQKIPKTIHYCWFGGKPIPDRFKEYMNSWRKYCPDYEIIQWNESNYDIRRSPYMEQAYKAGKWAFVSDYARVDIIHEHGGIYLDTDVEIIKSLDNLLYDEMYCGFESNSYINFGLGYGAVKGHNILSDLLEEYNKVSFINPDGSLNQTACAVYQLEVLVQNGLNVINEFQRLKNVVVYPSEVFAPRSLLENEANITPNTHSIHHYSSTWWDENAAEGILELKENLVKYKERMEEKG